MKPRKKSRREQIGKLRKEAREKFDCDYLEQLDDEAFKFFKRFILAVYANKSDKARKPLYGKREMRKITKASNASRNDIYTMFIRVDVTPRALEELTPSPSAHPRKKKKRSRTSPTIDRIYEEDGVKVTRYRSVKK